VSTEGAAAENALRRRISTGAVIVCLIGLSLGLALVWFALKPTFGGDALGRPDPRPSRATSLWGDPLGAVAAWIPGLFPTTGRLAGPARR